MVRKMQQHIFAAYHLQDALIGFKIRMLQPFELRIQQMCFTQRREALKILEVMVSCSCHQVISTFLQVHSLQDIIKHIRINSRIINKSDGCPSLSLFNSFLNLFRYALIKVFQQIKLRITGEFDGGCLKSIMRENIKDICQAKPDYIIQQDHKIAVTHLR